MSRLNRMLTPTGDEALISRRSGWPWRPRRPHPCLRPCPGLLGVVGAGERGRSPGVRCLPLARPPKAGVPERARHGLWTRGRSRPVPQQFPRYLKPRTSSSPTHARAAPSASWRPSAPAHADPWRAPSRSATPRCRPPTDGHDTPSTASRRSRARDRRRARSGRRADRRARSPPSAQATTSDDPVSRSQDQPLKSHVQPSPKQLRQPSTHHQGPGQTRPLQPVRRTITL